MSRIDPSIPLQARPAQFKPIGDSIAEAIQMRGMQQQQQMHDIQMQALQAKQLGNLAAQVSTAPDQMKPAMYRHFISKAQQMKLLHPQDLQNFPQQYDENAAQLVQGLAKNSELELADLEHRIKQGQLDNENEALKGKQQDYTFRKNSEDRAAAAEGRAVAAETRTQTTFEQNQNKPIEVNPGATLFDPNKREPIFTAPVKADKLSFEEETYNDYLKSPDAKRYGANRLGFDKYRQEQRVAIAAANKVDLEQVVNYSDAGVNKVGILNKKTHQIEELKTPSGGTAEAKLPEVPAALKTQATAALTALKQVDNIAKIVNENPQLVGPIIGRFETFMQGVGKNPFVGTKDERLGAQLAEHLNALFAQELRSMFPGRTNEQMQELIKSTSAQLKQNPNLMFGILEGIKTNEGMVLDTAKRQGFVEDRFANNPPPPSGGANANPYRKKPKN